MCRRRIFSAIHARYTTAPLYFLCLSLFFLNVVGATSIERLLVGFAL